MTDEIMLSEENFTRPFEKYFFDIRRYKPQKGQVMAKFTFIAELLDNAEKRDIIELLRNTDKAIPISQLMRKVLHSSELDSYTVPIAIVKDLLEGMPVEEVARKPYEYVAEMFFYTQKEYVPENQHWSVISLLNLNDYVEASDGGTISCKFDLPSS